MKIRAKKYIPFGAKRIDDLFLGCNVYYSGSISGVSPDPELGRSLVTFMLMHGAKVPSAHVAAGDEKEAMEIFFHQSGGYGFDKKGKISITPEVTHRVDMGWVNDATHVVAVVDGPSHGVGMEIQRALLKPKCGLNPTPVLCLVKPGNLERLSWMIRGASDEFGKMITVCTYTSAEEARKIVEDFLTRRR